MYAIFEAKGKQWRAEKGATLRLPSMEVEPGESVTFDRVLLAKGDGEILVGRPALEGAAVTAEVLKHGRGEKIVVFKAKKRKGYRRKQGHRQNYTEIRIVGIDLEGATAPASEKAEPEPEAVRETKAPPEPREAPAAEEAPAPVAEADAEPAVEAEADAEPAAGEISATDAARQLAAEHGLELAAIEGTGKDGRILKGDVEKAIREREEED